MKPLSELVKDWRVEAKVMCSQAHSVDGSSGGLFMAAGELQAWLREADEMMLDYGTHYGCVERMWVRRKLLGTTQKGKQEDDR